MEYIKQLTTKQLLSIYFSEKEYYILSPFITNNSCFIFVTKTDDYLVAEKEINKDEQSLLLDNDYYIKEDLVLKELKKRAKLIKQDIKDHYSSIVYPNKSKYIADLFDLKLWNYNRLITLLNK